MGLAQILGHENLEHDGQIHEKDGRAIGRSDGEDELLIDAA